MLTLSLRLSLSLGLGLSLGLSLSLSLSLTARASEVRHEAGDRARAAHDLVGRAAHSADLLRVRVRG